MALSKIIWAFCPKEDVKIKVKMSVDSHFNNKQSTIRIIYKFI